MVVVHSNLIVWYNTAVQRYKRIQVSYGRYQIYSSQIPSGDQTRCMFLQCSKVPARVFWYCFWRHFLLSFLIYATSALERTKCSVTTSAGQSGINLGPSWLPIVIRQVYWVFSSFGSLIVGNIRQLVACRIDSTSNRSCSVPQSSVEGDYFVLTPPPLIVGW